MAQFQVRRGRIRRILALVLLLACFGGIFCMMELWESHQQEQAMLQQDKVDEAARRRREGWIQVDGQWYSPKTDIETLLVIDVDQTEPFADSGSYNNDGQADFLMLAIFDRKQKEMTVLHINRDTMTEISVYDRNGLYAGTQTAQIALAHAYGDGMEKSCENTVNAVSQLFYGLPIHGYCALNMEVVPLLNDAVGGVDVVIPESAAGADMGINGTRHKTGWKTGQQVHLMGNDAYTFIRYRDTDQAQSAEARLERQKTYLQAFIAQAVNAVKSDLTLPLTLYTTISPYMVTDITAQEAVHIASEAVSYSFSGENLYSMEGEVRMGEIFEEFYPDETALYELILQVFYEEVPEGTEQTE